MPAVVLTYYVTTCLAALALGRLQPLSRVDPAVLQLTQFGPAAGVLAVLACWRGRRFPLATGLGFPRYVLVRLAVVVGLVALVFVVFLGIAGLLEVPAAGIPPDRLQNPIWLLVVTQTLGAGGEELGWRCFLQPYLASRFGTLRAAILVGLLWGCWHIQVFASGPAFTAAFLVAAVAISVILAVVLDASPGHAIVIASCGHVLLNLGVLVVVGEAAGASVELSFAAACGIVATIAVLVRRWARSQPARPELRP
jgi:membrane protease YdiL (CAAX protease family)